MESRNIASENENLRAILISLAVEGYRFRKTFERVLSKLDAGEQCRYSSQLSWFSKRLETCMEDAGFTISNLEGQPFDPGVPATPLNIAEFAPEDSLIIQQMLEPVITNKDGLVRPGTVILKKAPQ